MANIGDSITVLLPQSNTTLKGTIVRRYSNGDVSLKLEGLNGEYRAEATVAYSLNIFVLLAQHQAGKLTSSKLGAKPK